MKDYSYFIPGYTGFCPELKDHFGQTYGHATRCVIKKKPHLEERLAPVCYRYGRYGRVKGKLGKQLHSREREKYEYLKSKRRNGILDNSKAKDKDIYEAAGDMNRRMHPSYNEDQDDFRKRYYEDYESADIHRTKHPTEFADGGKIKKLQRECAYPKYVFVNGYAEFVSLETWATRRRQKSPYGYYPCVAMPCSRVRDCPEYDHKTIRHVQFKECHPEVYAHKKNDNFDTGDRMWRMPQLRPFRQSGVISKYTGHIPGMQFSFGESYGTASDRLLQKHHIRMKELKIKS